MLLRVALQTARDDYETRRERQRKALRLLSGQEGTPGGSRTSPNTDASRRCARRA